jgi:hypothetical protein
MKYKRRIKLSTKVAIQVSRQKNIWQKNEDKIIQIDYMLKNKILRNFTHELLFELKEETKLLTCVVETFKMSYA